jgi:hypothetical protein
VSREPILDKIPVMQKTWIPEGSQEYFAFKQLTQENCFLSRFLGRVFDLGKADMVLDVGGRKGDIAFAVQKPDQVHIVDPDPTIEPTCTPSRLWRSRIQDIDLSEVKYRLIICSHVMGYLSEDNDQCEVIKKLGRALAPGGTLVLFYNRNTEYMADLLRHSRIHLSNGHFDFFDERIVDLFSSDQFQVRHLDVWFRAKYKTKTELSRACWFLFGSTRQDIQSVADIFLHKLSRDNMSAELGIEQRIMCITKIPKDVHQSDY